MNRVEVIHCFIHFGYTSTRSFIDGLAEFLNTFAFDHVVGYSFASDIEKSFNVQVIGGEGKFKNRSLVDFEEIAIPADDVIGAPGLGLGRIVLVVSRPLDHLFQDGGVDIGKGDNFVSVFQAEVFQHGFDGYGLLSDLHVNGEDFAVTGLKLDGRHV